jgi:hypothetical protein
MEIGVLCELAGIIGIRSFDCSVGRSSRDDDDDDVERFLFFLLLLATTTPTVTAMMITPATARAMPMY